MQQAEPSAPETLVGTTIDPVRVICLPMPTRAALVAAIGGLANGLGGTIMAGVAADASGSTIREITGVNGADAAAQVLSVAQEFDPALSDIVSVRPLPASGPPNVLIVSVRQSPAPPHLDSTTGSIFLHDLEGTRRITRRDELDRLYHKGRAVNERAERVLTTTIERLSLAHHGHYGIAVVACLRTPSAEAYRQIRNRPETLADPDDRFVAAWGFDSARVHVGPGEAEIRNEREVTGALRVGRAGYAVAAELLRRPPRDVLGSVGDMARRLDVLIGSTCRILAKVEAPTIVPRLVCDGIKSCRLTVDGETAGESAPCPVDLTVISGPAGDAGDESYRSLTRDAFLSQLLPAFGITALDPRTLPRTLDRT